MTSKLTWINNAGVYSAKTPIGTFLVGAVVSAGPAFDAVLSVKTPVGPYGCLQGTHIWSSKVCPSVKEAKAEAQRYYARKCGLASITDSAF